MAVEKHFDGPFVAKSCDVLKDTRLVCSSEFFLKTNSFTSTMANLQSNFIMICFKFLTTINANKIQTSIRREYFPYYGIERIKCFYGQKTRIRVICGYVWFPYTVPYV